IRAPCPTASGCSASRSSTSGSSEGTRRSSTSWPTSLCTRSATTSGCRTTTCMLLRTPPVSGRVRRMRLALAAAALLALAAPALAQDERPTPASIVAAAPADEWKAISPADLLVMTLAPDRDGDPRQVTIQLIPRPFSEPWVDNIRTLARAHWWDG